ncbi:MAG: hypothetical protein Q7R81_02170 [Candidatus Peregrinibacteria bacterium]|nr:hypothetical protein [Candidatus Peregrinibacteria bacterium]
MKKFSLLLGTLGGAMAGYLLSNTTLREQLMKAKDPETAAKTLGKHLQRDGKKIAQEVQDFVQSDDVQKNLKKAKAYALDKLTQAKKEAKVLMKQGAASAGKAVRKAGKTATKKVKAFRASAV